MTNSIHTQFDTQDNTVLMIRTEDGAVYTITKSLLELHCRNRDVETLASKTALNHMFKDATPIADGMELAVVTLEADGEASTDGLGSVYGGMVGNVFAHGATLN